MAFWKNSKLWRKFHENLKMESLRKWEGGHNSQLGRHLDPRRMESKLSSAKSLLLLVRIQMMPYCSISMESLSPIIFAWKLTTCLKSASSGTDSDLTSPSMGIRFS